MKPGDRICIVGDRKFSGFMIYATNVVPMRVDIPSHFDDSEARELLTANAQIYEKVRQRKVREYEVLQKEFGIVLASDINTSNPTIDQMVDRALSK